MQAVTRVVLMTVDDDWLTGYREPRFTEMTRCAIRPAINGKIGVIFGQSSVWQWRLLAACLCLTVFMTAGAALCGPVEVTAGQAERGYLARLATPRQLPLRTKGRYIVDALGQRFKLASVNWYGAHDFRMVPAGLDRQPVSAIVRSIIEMGFNSVRLPFSNAMLRAVSVDPAAVAANPDLIGKSPLAVYDRVIDELTKEGVVVIINNHTSHAMWCCGYDEDGLWFTDDYPESQWLQDWVLMAERYHYNPGVVGVDLRNEVRVAKIRNTFLPKIPHWGGKVNNWHQAAQRAGNLVLDSNPNLLVIVEGINFPRLHLRRARQEPVHLKVAHRLVYGAHNYGFIGPHLTGSLYGDMAYETLANLLTDEWGGMVTENRDYTAPVWVSEFGEALRPRSQSWFGNIIRYLSVGDFDFAYWSLNPGPKLSGEPEMFALLSHETWRPINGDWRLSHLRTIMAPRRGPGVEPNWEGEATHRFEVLKFADADTNHSQRLGDWDPGAYKATCDDRSRLVGVSTGKRMLQPFAHLALCSDFALKLDETRAAAGVTLRDNGGDSADVGVHGTGQDWHPGANKLECGMGAYVSGVAQTHTGLNYRVDGVRCVNGGLAVPAKCQVLKLDDGGDQRATDIPGDWDSGRRKLQCGLGDYVAGISLKKGHLEGLLCCTPPSQSTK